MKWLYALVAVLALALAFETGYLLRSHKEAAKREEYPVRPAASAVRAVQAPLRTAVPARLSPVLADDWDPFREMEEMRREMDRLFQDSTNRMARSGAAPSPSYDPDLDFRETPKEYVVRLDLPGLEKDKIDVKVQNGTLVVSGRRETESESRPEEGGFYRMERSFGSFTRAFPLPADADSAGMTAETKDGVLTVRIPRAEKATESVRKIDVR